MTWQRIGTDEPGDMQRDLFGPYWAQIGPDGRRGWSWTILDRGSHEIAAGYAPTGVAARAAVAAWEQANRRQR